MSRRETIRAAVRANALIWVACCLTTGCSGTHAMGGYQSPEEGNPAQGKTLIEQYGCGSCHVVPGIRTAHGMVGPPLLFFSRRTTIAGELPNTPDNLARWIMDPPAIEEETAMPDLGVSRTQARDITAYLYTLQ